MFDNENDRNKIQIACECQPEFDLAFTPIIQSGGKYELKPTAESNNDYLKSDTIIITSGVHYHEYNSTCARTLMINPSEE